MNFFRANEWLVVYSIIITIAFIIAMFTLRRRIWAKSTDDYNTVVRFNRLDSERDKLIKHIYNILKNSPKEMVNTYGIVLALRNTDKHPLPVLALGVEVKYAFVDINSVVKVRATDDKYYFIDEFITKSIKELSDYLSSYS